MERTVGQRSGGRCRRRRADSLNSNGWWLVWWFCCVVVWWAGWGGAAWSNMAQPWNPGEPLGEPVGDFKALHILREELRFDLRPIKQGGKPHILAIYHLENRGPKVKVPLFFVAPRLRQGKVTLNGKPVRVGKVVKRPLPPSWKLPQRAPSVGGGKVTFEVRKPSKVKEEKAPSKEGKQKKASRKKGTQKKALRKKGTQKEASSKEAPSKEGKQKEDLLWSGMLFTVELSSGKHTLSVSYKTLPAEYHGSRPHREYQIGYVLSPARSWGSFGRLEVEVFAPPAWKVATSIPLQRKKERWQGTFAQIPADTLLLSTSPPVRYWGIEGILFWGGLVLGLLFSFWLGWRRKRLLQEMSWGQRIVLVLLLVAGAWLVTWGLPFVGHWLGRSFYLKEHLSRSWSYSVSVGNMLYATLGGLITLLLSTIAFLLATFLYTFKERRSSQAGTGGLQ